MKIIPFNKWLFTSPIWESFPTNTGLKWIRNETTLQSNGSIRALLMEDTVATNQWNTTKNLFAITKYSHQLTKYFSVNYYIIFLFFLVISLELGLHTKSSIVTGVQERTQSLFLERIHASKLYKKQGNKEHTELVTILNILINGSKPFRLFCLFCKELCFRENMMCW